MKKCSPKGRDCIEKNSSLNFNCSLTCQGLYLDVQWMDTGLEFVSALDKEKLDMMVKEYEEFKKMNVKHYRFKSGATAVTRRNEYFADTM